MNFKIIFLVALHATYSYTSSGPALAVVLMIKDEAPVVCDTLRPLVDGGIEHFLISDTGSTDGTQQVVKDFFAQYPTVTYHLVEKPFVDFSTSRNHALDEAEKLFPEIPFLLMPDAEWYLYNTQELLTFCQNERDGCHDCLLIPLHIIGYNPEKYITLNYHIGRLIRSHKGVRFVGVVHEALNRLGTKNSPNTIYFEYKPTDLGRKKSAERWQRDKELLLKSHQENPADPRTLFYLAQTYACLGDWQNAYLFYSKRAALAGWDEENFITFVRLGEAAERLATQQKNSAANTEEAPQEIEIKKNLQQEAVKQYLHAFSLRPHRAEPLIKLANHYLQKNMMQEACMYAKMAIAVPYPKNDILFIDTPAYTFTRYDILGICAWYTQEYELGEWATKKALEVSPNAAHLHRNLKLYQDRACGT